jgi:hypothetical protein
MRIQMTPSTDVRASNPGLQFGLQFAVVRVAFVKVRISSMTYEASTHEPWRTLSAQAFNPWV